MQVNKGNSNITLQWSCIHTYAHQKECPHLGHLIQFLPLHFDIDSELATTLPPHTQHTHPPKKTHANWDLLTGIQCKAAYALERATIDAKIKRHKLSSNLLKKSGIPGKHKDSKGKVKKYTFDKPVLFVHIGKAGGGAVQMQLRSAGISFDAVHLSYTPSNAILSHDWIVVGVRDPVARFVSAYNWGNPNSAKFEVGKNNKLSGKALPFYKCFPNVNVWVRALRQRSGSGSGSGTTSCEQIAFNAKGVEDVPASHMSVKTDSHTYSSPLVACSYVGLFLGDFVKSTAAASTLRHLYIIQSEQLDDDVSHFKGVLERRKPELVKNKSFRAGTHHNVDDRHARDAQHLGLQNKSLTTVEPDVRKYLEALLAPEYLVLNRIMQLSVNKNESNYYCTREGTIATAPLC